MRLTTLMLLVVILGLSMALILQHRRHAQILQVFTLYRQRGSESIIEVLERVPRTPLAVDENTEILDVLKALRKTSISPSLPSGIPIYVDPIGLQESGSNLASRLKGPFPPMAELTLDNQMKLLLEPMGLSAVVKDGMFVVTSKEDAQNLANEETSDEALYQRYRNLLK
jgi:hypothetical protein